MIYQKKHRNRTSHETASSPWAFKKSIWVSILGGDRVLAGRWSRRLHLYKSRKGQGVSTEQSIYCIGKSLEKKVAKLQSGIPTKIYLGNETPESFPKIWDLVCRAPNWLFMAIPYKSKRGGDWITDSQMDPFGAKCLIENFSKGTSRGLQLNS